MEIGDIMTKQLDNCNFCGENEWINFNKMVSVAAQEGSIQQMIVEAQCVTCSHEQIVVGPCPDPVAVKAIAEYESQ